jgi:large subunit ribosomal protein L13
MKTFIPKVDGIEKKWYILDLKGATLGKAAIEAARIIRGKNKTIFTPHIDTGDFVVAINASQMVISGNKGKKKLYYHFSGYPGGLKTASYERLMKTNPSKAFTLAVKGMLPGNRLGRKLLKKLHVYADDKHRHQAQKPEIWKLVES